MCYALGKVDAMNKLYFGDNLKILREYVADASVDLIYLDPPFNSSATYNVLFKEKSGEESAAQITAFEDTWQWGLEPEGVYKPGSHGWRSSNRGSFARTTKPTVRRALTVACPAYRRKRRNRAARRRSFLISHSHITSARQPCFLMAASCSASLAALRASLARQKPRLDFGTVARRHSLCWCQKQPWTKTAFCRPGKAMSGFPGSSCK